MSWRSPCQHESCEVSTPFHEGSGQSELDSMVKNEVHLGKAFDC